MNPPSARTAFNMPSLLRPTSAVIVLSRKVYRGEQRLHVSKRALSLVITLAILEHVPRQALLDLLWGDDNLAVETNALKMLLSRARHQLGDTDVIRVENGVYSLRGDVVTDFNQLQRLLV